MTPNTTGFLPWHRAQIDGAADGCSVPPQTMAINLALTVPGRRARDTGQNRREVGRTASETREQ